MALLRRLRPLGAATLLAATLCLAATGRAQAPGARELPDSGGTAAAEGARAGAEPAALRWYAIPNFAYDTDDGLGFGARAELALGAPGDAPYDDAYVIHLFATTRGYQHHRLRWDRPRFGPAGRLRFTLHLAWRQWLNDGYWGVGNDQPRSPGVSEKRYRYSLFQPFAYATLRAKVAGPWAAFGSLNAKYSVVEPYAGSLLEEERPYGMDGGLATVLAAGLLYDSRQPEVSPERGLLAELSLRGNPPLPRGAGAFWGLTAGLRAFRAALPGLVLAGRVLAEWLDGAVPFYEMVHWGGSSPVAGFGGSETLRGLAFGRWHGRGKALANAELRWDLLRHTLGSQSLRWQLAPYADCGLVFGEGDTFAGASPLHPAFGLGLRAVYAETFVGRIDSGIGLDPVRDDGGDVSLDPTWGLYVVFDQPF